MAQRIEPKMFCMEDIGPYRFSQRISTYPYAIGKYAPHLHIMAYHENVRKVRVTPYPNETIELDIPKKFTLADTKRFVADNEMELLLALKIMLDCETNLNPHFDPDPIAYESKVSILGKELPIHALPEGGQHSRHLNSDAIYLEPGLFSGEIRDTVLDLLGEMAYELLNPRLDHYAKLMNAQYSGLEIDDGRRTFGSYNKQTKVVFLSRRLLMMSESVIDFLIVHELAHIDSFSHGAEHDAVMAKILPNYEELDVAFFESCEGLLRKGWI
ncbi:M48 family metallopeptidase [Christensenellaceae bacterium OttesenSCG-928-M15]|nr:M48 family metallopeptidase [Christensenellaceae bacterium OttesenSCG-928-M15]